MSTNCGHYLRGCNLLSPCCKEWFPCRLCHNEAKEHEMDRHAVKRVRCNACLHEQPPQRVCEQCQAEMGQYFCQVCNLFDDEQEKKQIFHCDKCGICRVGGADKFFHCDVCSGCYATKYRSTHRCINNAMRQECCICYEDIFNSRESPSVLRCGHVLHRTCYVKMLRYTMFECPFCRDSVPPYEPPTNENGEVEEDEGDEVSFHEEDESHGEVDSGEEESSLSADSTLDEEEFHDVDELLEAAADELMHDEE